MRALLSASRRTVQSKNITVNDWQRCHAKNRVAISLAPFWRLTVAVNDEPENLMVLPPIDESIEDKIIILRASRFQMPMPTATIEQRKAFWQKLVDELPAFLAFLFQWEIPSKLVSARFDVTHFHHPDILQAIDNLAPESRLLRLIDEELFEIGSERGRGSPNSWSGSYALMAVVVATKRASFSRTTPLVECISGDLRRSNLPDFARATLLQAMPGRSIRRSFEEPRKTPSRCQNWLSAEG